MSDTVDAGDIAAAAERLSSVVTTTPLHESPRLGAALGRPVWLKREDQQISRSYKLRGAFTLISSLTEAERALGVVCASAGNHALGVAYSCQLLGVRARVFLPTTTPRQKRQQIQAVGGDLVEAVVAGHSFDEASAAALADSATTGCHLRPPLRRPPHHRRPGDRGRRDHPAAGRPGRHARGPGRRGRPARRHGHLVPGALADDPPRRGRAGRCPEHDRGAGRRATRCRSCRPTASWRVRPSSGSAT